MLKKLFLIAKFLLQGGIPPKTVPDDRTAREYYELGKRYKLVGWITQSKKALNLSIKMDPDGVGKTAATYMKAYLPLHDISEVAIQENIEAANKILGDPEGAEKSFRLLLERFPDFEWPCGNLGYLYIDQGRFDEAREILGKALEINPQYTNAFIFLAAISHKEKDQEETDRQLRKVLKIDPDFDSNVLVNYPFLKKRLKLLKKS